MAVERDITSLRLQVAADDLGDNRVTQQVACNTDSTNENLHKAGKAVAVLMGSTEYAIKKVSTYSLMEV